MTENLKNNTLFRGTYLYSPYMGVAPRKKITVYKHKIKVITKSLNKNVCKIKRLRLGYKERKMFKTMLETCLLYLSNHFCDFCPAKIAVQLMFSCSEASCT